MKLAIYRLCLDSRNLLFWICHTIRFLTFDRLQVLTGLGGLKLANNQIVDISPLAGLVNLNLLNIANNRIMDFSPLAGVKSPKPEYKA